VLPDHIPDREVVKIDGAGHACNLEKPWAFDAAMIDFLTSPGGSIPPPAHNPTSFIDLSDSGYSLTTFIVKSSASAMCLDRPPALVTTSELKKTKRDTPERRAASKGSVCRSGSRRPPQGQAVTSRGRNDAAW
jgi:hypothetical protein